MSTPYSKAWERFISSEQAQILLEHMEQGAYRPYSENRLREAFDAGWHAANEIREGTLPKEP